MTFSHKFRKKKKTDRSNFFSTGNNFLHFKILLILIFNAYANVCEHKFHKSHN